MSEYERPPAPHTAEELLEATIEWMSMAGDRGYWLTLQCACFEAQRIMSYPCKLLARELGPRKARTLRVRDVVQKLRCKRCRSAPLSVSVTDNPAAVPPAYPPTWRVRLFPLSG